MVDSSPTHVGLTKESCVMVVWSKESDDKEESVRKTEGSGSGEAAEGLVRLGKNARELVLSEKETLADLLKRVTDIPPTRGRATRTQNKQSGVELEKALEESKRKAAAKGKKKVIEHVEPVEIDEIDLILQDEEETEEMEVVTPKAKKAKTSSKKSVSKTKSAEPSTLAKRTRYALKPRKVKIVEEEEWSGEEEEESNAEKDNMVKFGKKTILKGKLLRDLEEEGMLLLLEKLQLQG
ncbi:uncharacterized protein [Nicotiana tomentosiformis]|uniref:uncharacterized protein n=1 Tax=Nicotiana tomentosiformis TaxID=4098 RepID=UPI00388CEC42